MSSKKVNKNDLGWIKLDQKNTVFREKEWYREKIIDMVNQLNNEDYLFKIFHYILAKYRRDKK